jgi:NADPH2:quinone reductase
MSALAWRVSAVGEPITVLTLDELGPDQVGDGDVRIDVRANGLNFLDVSICRGTHPVRPPLPFVPGAELVGIVTEVGRGVAGIHVGDRVAAMHPLAYGCFRKNVVVPAYTVYPVPESMPDAHAASLLVTYQTAYVSLVRRAEVAPGEWVLVHAAAGALGSALLQVARARGARVIATAGSPEKRDLCLEQGAEHALDYRDPGLPDLLREVTDGHGVDIVCDSVGGAVFDASLEAAAFEARILPLGWSGGSVPTVDPGTFLARNLTLVGVSWGSAYPGTAPEVVRATHAEILRLYESGDVRPLIGQLRGYDELPDALQRVGEAKTTGKSVVSWVDADA